MGRFQPRSLYCNTKARPTMAQILQKFFAGENALARLEAHAQRLLHAQHIVQRHLPSYLAQGCGVAQVDGERLVLRADNGALATKLRQALPSLRAALARDGLVVAEIQVKVGLRIEPPPKPPAPARSVPANAVADMENLLGSLPDDSPLRAALARFVTRSNRR